MPHPRTLPLLLFIVATVFASSLSASESIGDERKVYIVYLGHLPRTEEPEGISSVEFAHHDLLNEVLDDGSSASDRIVRSYKRSLNGFAAKLSEEEAHKLSGMNGVVSVFPSRIHKPLTTRSWDFLGLPQTPKEELPLEGDVIVGMLDTGVWPDSPSFSDEGFGPPPSRWKGTCQNFTCNNKIIGARAYSDQSPLDYEGHGSHTASTVAGRVVANVSFDGLATGTARGAVPGARLAIYKVCKEGHCPDADILAGFDDAIADGVDVISVSIGKSPSDYFKDAQAIGSFHAMRRGVLTSASAGNSRRVGGKVCNIAPWMLSMAASNMDRQFTDKIVLGNGDTVVGTSINTFPTITNATLAFPANGSCDSEVVGGPYKGKILLCPHKKTYFTSGPVGAALLSGAVGVVLSDARVPDEAFTLPLPGLVVTQDKFDQIMAYVNSTSNPVGTIDRTVTMGNPLAPVAASFSSPGPNMITPSLLKPDLSAPGIDIIPSWSPLASPSGYPDMRKVQYNIISGTSMACPHASGAAAYVKSFHRDWSLAMIMSALITTAIPMNTPANSNTTALKYGAGQLNPWKAQDPSLVYDTTEGDYVAMLCAQNYTAEQLALVTGTNTTACATNNNGSTSGTPGDLNYPSMAARVEPGKNFTVAFPRTATNVGAANSMYNLKVVLPIEAANDLTIDVSPSCLEFSAQGQKVSFTVMVSGVAMEEGRVHSAAIVWHNNEHEVRSPVVVYAITADVSQENVV